MTVSWKHTVATELSTERVLLRIASYPVGMIYDFESDYVDSELCRNLSGKLVILSASRVEKRFDVLQMTEIVGNR